MTQGLDRRITLRIQGPHTLNEYQEQVPGVITEHPEWCSTEDSGYAEVDTRAGTRLINRKQFLIRYRRDVLEAFANRITVRDEYGNLYNVELVNESFDPMVRRKFITITALAEVFG